jgi:hypothetical protein
MTFVAGGWQEPPAFSTCYLTPSIVKLADCFT